MKAIFPAWTAAIRDQSIEAKARQEWLKAFVENGINTVELVEIGLAACRKHNSPFLPSVGQFIDLCHSAKQERHPPMEACFAELTKYISDNRKDLHNLSPILYHTVQKNMDFYNYKKIEKDYDRVKYFEIAYKATLFQLETGSSLYRPPEPEALIEQEVKAHDSPESIKAKDEHLGGIFAMLEKEPEKKPVDNSHAQAQLEKAKSLLNKN